MTEPVPGQTPEPAVADDATATPPQAVEPQAVEPGSTDADAEPAATEPEPDGPEATGPGSVEQGSTAANPQELFGSLSLSAIEADIDRLMSEKMSQLDGMLAGLEDLVQKLEGEITNLESSPDEPGNTPQG